MRIAGYAIGDLFIYLVSPPVLVDDESKPLLPETLSSKYSPRSVK